MHLVVCIKQVPDFCVNSRRFSDEHDHALWEGAARALPSDHADPPCELTCTALSKNARHCNCGILRSSPQRPIGEETRRRADDCRSHMTLSVAFVAFSTQIVPSSMRPISRSNYLKESN
ncbi:hypothetical protein [Sinorhizobium meliloti]|uniref:hypothetical protein n=1 Tax=Rhizobium meliloti TaxID=382 RepID=UPI000FDB2F05|nr:hypothetical protein [Sinorhizobium meliloti]MCM5690922.1 hypothetical protein [Sinorhizobium meliloti]RVG19574.1 hypothetical protein CN233_36055 [Sinorhizobium meliloti]RVK84386.1 hypothetical protein CN152_36040 [Sinorhizobium meliloti]RVN33912.1 hypothetical protein CN113_35575 [Sinorhizobium meliloti]RVO51375.1 hypothetical protein CN092_24970 [Sinorhizobium meliloti]